MSERRISAQRYRIFLNIDIHLRASLCVCVISVFLRELYHRRQLIFIDFSLSTTYAKYFEKFAKIALQMAYNRRERKKKKTI